LNYVLSQNPDLCRVYFDRLADPESIQDSDVARFDMMIGSYLACLMQTYHLFSEGTLGDGIWTHQLQQLKWLIKHPGFTAHWNRWERPAEVPFNALVAELINNQEQSMIEIHPPTLPQNASPTSPT
jgi:hypothetical protein